MPLMGNRLFLPKLSVAAVAAMSPTSSHATAFEESCSVARCAHARASPK